MPEEERSDAITPRQNTPHQAQRDKTLQIHFLQYSETNERMRASVNGTKHSPIPIRKVMREGGSDESRLRSRLPIRCGALRSGPLEATMITYHLPATNLS